MNSAGHLFMVSESGGTAFPGTNAYRWIVEKSVDDGASWQVVDDGQYTPGVSAGLSISPLTPMTTFTLREKACQLSMNRHPGSCVVVLTRVRPGRLSMHGTDTQRNMHLRTKC